MVDYGLSDILVGRKIVHAEMGGNYPSFGYDKPEGLLVLDDGTKLYLVGNEGCGGCSAGWYELESVATVDNIVTSVKVVEDPRDDYSDCDGEGKYEIFVFANNEKINVATFTGDDGNGYYGSGFAFHVVKAGE